MLAPSQIPIEFRPAPSTMASFADNSQFPWMEIALNEAGVREQRGRRHSARILEYFSSVTSRVHDDETAWCSAFANWVMKEIGQEGTGRLNARSWATWGHTVPNDSPHYGAIAVLWRGSTSGWKGHVAFYCGEESGNMILLGGNQSDSVCLSRYPRTRLLTFRWPAAFPPPNLSV